MTDIPEIPHGLRELFDASGPVLRYRLLRDVLNRDDSYIQTAQLGLDLARLPEISALEESQDESGTWGGSFTAYPPLLAGGMSSEGASYLTTEHIFLRLCELGRERSAAIESCLEKVLLPTLFRDDLLWEYGALPGDKAYQRAARHLLRDKALRLVCRATREADELIRPIIETMLAEWELFLSPENDAAPRTELAPPTADAYAALCWYPWSDDELPRIHNLVSRLIAHAERQLSEPAAPDAPFAPSVFRLQDKWEYLSRPHELLYELELAARLGIVRETDFTRWLLEELEAHQDADGLFRFDLESPVQATWYFPLEKQEGAEFSIEWSFRAALIFKLLEFDF